MPQIAYNMPLLAFVAGIVIVVFLGLVGLLIVYRMWRNDIDLSLLLSEKDNPPEEQMDPRPAEGQQADWSDARQAQHDAAVGARRQAIAAAVPPVPAPRASLSRFQFLIFTFIIGMCILVVTLDSGEFPKLDGSILGLLGISGGSFLVSKSIQQAGARKDK